MKKSIITAILIISIIANITMILVIKQQQNNIHNLRIRNTNQYNALMEYHRATGVDIMEIRGRKHGNDHGINNSIDKL